MSVCDRLRLIRSFLPRGYCNPWGYNTLRRPVVLPPPHRFGSGVAVGGSRVCADRPGSFLVARTHPQFSEKHSESSSCMEAYAAVDVEPVASGHALHLIVLVHGIDGNCDDLRSVREAVVSGAFQAGEEVECWSSKVNHGGRTHGGIQECARRLWCDLQAKLESSHAIQRISMIGHSMGGLLCRAVAARLYATKHLSSRIAFDTLICIASPHLGCRLLGRGGRGGVAPLMVNFGPTLMRAGLRLIKGRTGPDLLLDNDALAMLADDDHCASLRAFQRRVVYCNGSMDWLVTVESASLLAAEELNVVLPLSKAGDTSDGASILWRPHKDEAADLKTSAAWPPSLELGRSSSGATVLELCPLPVDWQPNATAASHTTWDDVNGGRGRSAAAMLQRIRAVGKWELHLCHFGKAHSSFAGAVFSPHIDLVDHPKCTRHYGREVVRHLSSELFKKNAEKYALNVNEAPHPMIEPTDGTRV